MYCSITHYNKYLFCFINKHMLLCHNRSWIIPTGDHKKKRQILYLKGDANKECYEKNDTKIFEILYGDNLPRQLYESANMIKVIFTIQISF